MDMQFPRKMTTISSKFELEHPKTCEVCTTELKVIERGIGSWPKWSLSPRPSSSRQGDDILKSLSTRSSDQEAYKSR